MCHFGCKKSPNCTRGICCGSCPDYFSCPYEEPCTNCVPDVPAPSNECPLNEPLSNK